MTTSTRTGWERIASAVCLGLVLGSVVAIDDRVRDRFWMTVDRGVAYGLDDRAAGAGDYLDIVRHAVRDQSIAEAPVLFFGVICLGLMVLLLRS